MYFNDYLHSKRIFFSRIPSYISTRSKAYNYYSSIHYLYRPHAAYKSRKELKPPNSHDSRAMSKLEHQL